ncbi:MAG: hypothetical protein WAP57_04635, partial [Aquabacterium commune]
MSDKHLNEKEWAAFCKGAAYKGDALRKAMASFEQALKVKDAGAQASALDEVEAAADKLRGAHKGDKDLDGYLSALGKSVAKARKDAEAALKAASKAKADEADDDEDAESKPNVLLDPTKLLRQLKMCKQDPDRTVQFGFIDVKDKGGPVFALSPKLSGRKIYTLLQQATGVKAGAYGSCWVDGNAVCLQLDKPIAGLVKRVRLPIKAAGFRASRIVLWDESGTVFEQDSEDDEAGAAPTVPAAPGAPAPTAAPASVGNDATEQAAFQQRLSRIVAALPGLPTDIAKEAKLKASEAGVFARKQEWARASALLGLAERMIEKNGAAPAAPARSPAAEAAKPAGDGDTAKAFNARLAQAVDALKQAPASVAAEAKLKVSEAGYFARKQDFTQANALLDEAQR